MNFDGELLWHHTSLHFYGQWLPGDPRGFRTKRHREHVEGDYKNPPKEDYSDRHRRAKDSLKHPPTEIASADREIVCQTLLRSLDVQALDAAAIAVTKSHCHLLAKLPRWNAKVAVGTLKREVTRRLGTRYERPVWATRSRPETVRGCPHWTRTLAYILRHDREGGAVWVWNGPRVAIPGRAIQTAPIRESRIAERIRTEGDDWRRLPPLGAGDE